MPPTLASLFVSHTQSTRLLRLTTPLGAHTLLAERVHGAEALDAGFRFTITALALDAHVSLRSLLGQSALLELLLADHRCRPFHGHITMVEQTGANAGLARYTLVLEPWTAFLTRNRDSRVFQQLDVRAIVDAVFAPWQGQGTLAPSWRWELAFPHRYPLRSLSTQYQESDWAFASRLLREAGLFYFFEHAGDPASPTLGQHTLVIADHNSACKANPQGAVRFALSSAVMHEDHFDHWRCDARLLTNTVALSSWDYRAHSRRPVSAALYRVESVMASRDAPGQYAYPGLDQGQYLAQCQLDAIGTRRRTYQGGGTVRSAAPGTTFLLDGHPVHARASDPAERTFLTTRVTHTMRNNLDADMQARVDACFGAMFETGPIYRNRIDAIGADVPYRPDPQLHARPTVHGQQSAIVVGAQDAPIHTDRDHRVKVQFHWQRAIGACTSHSRLAHPVAQGHSGAPADDGAGTWVRVAAPVSMAGANWGGVALPRVGQEVLVDFIEGDIDRPIILGALYNSAGKPDAPHGNGHFGAGAATGNTPAWFPGARGAHAHGAVLSGLKSQALATSAWGTGAYSQLVFDDSPGQARVALQRYAAPHQGTDELNLGHLCHQCDNQRLHSVGLGAELKTEHSLAVRSGRGLLLTSDAQAQASGAQMDARPALAQVQASHALQVALAHSAQQHNAVLRDPDGSAPATSAACAASAASAELAPLAQMQYSADILTGVDNNVPAWTDAMLQLSSPAGVVATTPTSAVFAAGNTTSLSAGQAIDLAAQGASAHLVKSGIGLFAHGKQGARTGIALHAASGKVSSQSQSGLTRLTADKAVTVASIDKSVTVAAKHHVLLTVQGASVRIEGGNITLLCPGKIDFKATAKALTGPVSVPSTDIAHKINDLNKVKDLKIEYVDADDNPLANESIDIRFKTTTKSVILDSAGKAALGNVPMGPITANQPRRKRIPEAKKDDDELP